MMKSVSIKIHIYRLLFLSLVLPGLGCSEFKEEETVTHKDATLKKAEFTLETHGETSSQPTPFALPGESVNTDYALTLDGKKISLHELDEGIKLKLFDLEWARYELRKAALNEYLQTYSRKQTPQSINVLLTPPEPPRLYLTPAQQNTALRFEDAAEVPVRLSVFCNYQSSHCARMQASYQQLQADYGAQIGFEFYDFPQVFHAQAVSAANAVRCAHDMGVFDAFHKAMWLMQQGLDDAAYLRLAKQLGLDENRFRGCLSAQPHALAIDAHTELAKSFGFNQVPVTLVNGLYLSGPKPLEVFHYFIDLELARQGNPAATVVTGHQSENRSASPPFEEDSESQLSSEGAAERQAGQGSADMPLLPEDMPGQDELEYTPRPVVPALGEIPLSRDWIEDQLMQQAELESHFHAAEHEVEGVRLTKLKGVAESEFYQTLGLQEGDVLMRINEQWVHEAQNDLFEFLETGDTVAVVLVRKGLPVHLVYRIKD
jgi:protein-disulfide isomerase